MPTPESRFGFYPHRPLWADSSLPFAQTPALETTRMLSTVTYTFETPLAKIFVARDGLVLFAFQTTLPARKIQEHLNCFYLLLSSHAADFTFEAFLPVEELGLGDILVCQYAGETLTGAELIGVNPRTAGCFRERYLTTHLPVQPEKFDFSPDSFWDRLGRAAFAHAPGYRARQARVLPEAVYQGAVSDYARLSGDPLFVSVLGSLPQVLGPFADKNYAEALLFAWFVIEAYLYELWREKVQGGQVSQEESLSVSTLIRDLKTARVLPYEVGNDLHTVRIARNKVVHDKFRTPPEREPAALAIEALKEFIRRDVGLNLNLPLE